MVQRASVLVVILGLITALPVARAGAASSSEAGPAEGIAFFESRVRPVLVQHCYKCHSVGAGKSKGNLLLDSRAKIRAGGDRGPAVVPGDPDASVLLAAIAHSDPDLEMPPNADRLADSVIADIKAWILMGAPDPREGQVAATASPAVDLESGRRFWALKKPVVHQPPVTKDPAWTRRELDYFILAKLDAAGLVPSADAEPATLLRRLHFDLVGLPPAPEAVGRFVALVAARGFDAALEEEVDALLVSKQFGERWGRHWLDVARFAESSGKEANISFPYAWRYRDYVIDAISAGMPFDRFLVEQIAGDLLPYENDAERARLLIATGFLAVGPKNLDEGNALQFAADVVDEQIDALTRGVMASSVACARCHDHKFDPFSMEDYYALAGIFSSTRTYFGTFVSPANRVGGDPLVLPRGAGQPVLHDSIPPEKVVGLKAELAALKNEKAVTLRDALRIFWRSGGIEGQLEKVDESGRALPLAMGVTDREAMIDAPWLERGDIGRPGKRVPRGFPRVIAVADTAQVPSDHSGRLELARWLTHPDHPLTARVMVNRVWRHLLGAGLVPTVDNFGSTGERPSHPELLDTLAVRFTAGGWSLKDLVREIVLSRTYRQASTYRNDAFLADPENRLLWRAAKRRLDAEAIRDAMLAVSGELDATRRVGSLVGKEIGDRPISLVGLDARLPADLDGSRQRSVYLPVLRDRLPDVLDLFDFAEPSLVTGDRETTNVPVQALYLMNSPFVRSRARALADRLLRADPGNDDAARIGRGFLLCFSRDLSAAEMKRAASFLEPVRPRARADEKERGQLLTAFCQALLSTAEFRNLD
jgi:mono/diheme cytochrome c family protein